MKGHRGAPQTFESIFSNASGRFAFLRRCRFIPVSGKWGISVEHADPTSTKNIDPSRSA